MQQFNYKNITISGLPGCGSTTLLTELKEKLKADGWIGFSGGEFMRAYAIEKGLFDSSQAAHHSATVYSDDFDRQVDYGIREKVTNQEKWIIESWLSGFMAQNVPGTLKVLMTCSDDAVRIDRIVNRDNVDVSSAKASIYNRYQGNLLKWRRMYANEWQEWVVKTGKLQETEPIDFWRRELYDLVIDTFSNSKEKTLQLVLDAIKKK
ncbi:MAG TPA: AAA family ATPase [Candidatus Woesebacteria bacterium]|nr:AAA family ATPase [Candidatus Woesebacteria bacterium]